MTKFFPFLSVSFIISSVGLQESGFPKIESRDFVFAASDFTLVPQTERIEVPHRDIVRGQSGWNVATYNCLTGVTSFERFNENSYPHRGNNSIGTNRNGNIQRVFTEAGEVLFTPGYSPESGNDESHEENLRATPFVGDDDRVRITNPKADPYYRSGQIVAKWHNLVSNVDGGIYTVLGYGSGSMVGPDLLVTAAHVIFGDVTTGDFDDGITNFVFPDEVHYYPGLNGEADRPLCYDVTSAFISIQREYYEGRSLDYDWAAIKLNTEIGYITGWNGKASNWYEDGYDVSSYGYPGDKNGEMWLTTGVLTGSTNYIYQTNLDFVPGHSGSALFADFTDGTYMVGIATHYHWYWFFGDHTDYGGATRINSFIFAFLNSFVTSHNWPTC